MVSNVRLSCNAAVAFESEISDTPAFSDVTPWVKSFNTARGRSFELDQFETGTITMVMDNTDGRFTPERVSSAGFELYATNVVNPSITNVFPVSNGVTLSNYVLPSTGKSTLKVTIPALGGTNLSLVSAPTATVVPDTRIVTTFKLRKFSSGDASMTIRPYLDFYSINNSVIHSVPVYSYVDVNSDTVPVTLSITATVPADSYGVRVRFINRTGTTATNLLLEECHLSNNDPYVFNGAGSDFVYGSMVKPNRRVKIHSLMGGNLLPRWIASPVMGEEAYAPNGRFERTTGPNGELWWTYSYQNVSNPPTADAGSTSFRIKMNKATANTVTGTAVGTTGFYCQAPVYGNRTYRIRFWARADTTTGIPPSGTFRFEAFDRANNNNNWNSASVAWTPTNGSWFRVDQVFTPPADFSSADLRLTLRFGDAVLSQNVAADYAIELMGLQIQDVTYDNNPLDYVYGDGAEPVFNGYTEKWTSSTYSPYGNQEVEVYASDDFRIFSDTILPSPVKGAVLADPYLCTYMPFDDPAGSTRALDGWNSNLGGGDTITSTDGGSALTFGVAGFVGGANDGTCVQFSAAGDPTLGTFFQASGEPNRVTDPNWAVSEAQPDRGFQLSFWFKVPSGSRPANNTHYGVFAASRFSDGASTHLVSLYGDANGDYVYTRWGHISTGYLVQKTRGTLFDGNAHHVIINGSAVSNAFNGARPISVYVDGALAGSTTTPTGAVPIPTDHFVGGSLATDYSIARWMFVGFLSQFSLSTSNAINTTDKWNARNWEQSPSKTGGFTLGYIARCVNPNRYGAYDGDTGPTTGYNLYPASFSNASALSVLQGIAKDLRGYAYANKDGRITWYNRATVAGLLNGTPKVGNSASLDVSQGEGPEPGWSYESDISRIYNYIEGTHVNTGNVYTNIDMTSIGRFGRRPYTFESNMSNAANVETQVSDLLGEDDGYNKPRVQLGDLVFNLTPNYAVAAKILRLDLLGVLTLSNLPDYAPWETAYLQVEKIQHSVSVSGGTCEWNTTISVYNVGTPVSHPYGTKPPFSW
jgi:hypothetical protein